MNEQNKFILSILAILAVVTIAIMAITSDKPSDIENQFSVQAEGRVLARPDIAEINLGVTVDSEATAAEATSKGVNKMNLVIAALEGVDVDEKDIKTTNYNLFPSYDYTRKSGRELVGWNLDQNVRVKVRDLDRIGEVIAEATSAGANQIGGIAFTIDDKEDLKSEARALAIKEAKKKAKELSKQAGLNLGSVVNVFESQPSYPSPIFARAEALDSGFGGGIPTPDIQTGENEIVVSITLVYEVK